ncbi:Nucleotidyltransferase [Planctomycetales bacterium 10988]|nr:Nucleotidyltransferase [Planctomycetales bacterium 10988]
MAKATWEGVVLAESDDTVVVETNHYFPPDSIKQEFFEPSNDHSVCGWKGEASYFHVVVDGKKNENAAWYYPDPKEEAKKIQGRIAFWRGVKVEG